MDEQDTKTLVSFCCDHCLYKAVCLDSEAFKTLIGDIFDAVYNISSDNPARHILEIEMQCHNFTMLGY